MSSVAPASGGVVDQRKKVIMDHDGGVDDLVALALLASRPEQLNLLGCIVIDADCFIDPAFEVSGKVLSMIGGETQHWAQVPVGKSSLLGVHEFPKEWRKDATNMNDLPSVNTTTVLENWEKNKHHLHFPALSGEELMAKLVMEQCTPEDRVTICVTGPLSNVAFCIAKYGDAFLKNVEEVVIMGGAVDVKGNVFLGSTDGSAEWNLYWDAPAAKVVYDCSDLRKITFSLDSTNSVPVTSDFVRRFGAQNDYLLSQFVGGSWAMCTHFTQILGDDFTYFAWDALTAAYILEPTALVELRPVILDVEVAKDHPQEGRSKPASAEQQRAPENAKALANSLVAMNTKAEVFYNLVLDCSKLPPLK